jgi:nicotine blue oxidoreductase
VSVGAVVLAAGEASRFGGPKQRLLLPAVLERLREAPVDDVVVVEGAHELDATALGARIARCDDWALGPGASLRCGLAALGADAEAAVVLLADGPDLSPLAVARVLDAWRAGDLPVVAASYGGTRGHPLVLAREAWDRVPDSGLRDLPVRLVACDDLGDPGDVDRPEQLPERFS